MKYALIRVDTETTEITDTKIVNVTSLDELDEEYRQFVEDRMRQSHYEQFVALSPDAVSRLAELLY